MSILMHGAAVPAVLSPVRLSEPPIPMVELVGVDRREATPGDVGAAGSELAERATAPAPALGAAPAPPAPPALDDRVAALIDERDALRSRLNAQMVERGTFLSQLYAERAERDALRSQLDAETAERDVLRERLDAQRAERARLDEQVAELTAETRALTSQLADEGRRADRLAVSLAERDAAEQAAIQEMRQAYDELFAALHEEITAKDVSLRRAREGLAVSIVDRVLFPSGQAALTPDGRQILDRVAGVLATTSTRRIIIEGHTDDVPIGGALRARFPTNWELSTARATEVVRWLVERGLPARRLEAVGRADTRPVASNASEDGRRRNRRIEILLSGSAALPATRPNPARSTWPGSRPSRPRHAVARRPASNAKSQPAPGIGSGHGTVRPGASSRRTASRPSVSRSHSARRRSTSRATSASRARARASAS